MTEKQMAKKRGLRLHPNSGAGHIKDDASDDATVVEIKDAITYHTIKAKDLKALFVRAARQHKKAQYLVYFHDGDLTLICEIVPGGRQMIEGN